MIRFDPIWVVLGHIANEINDLVWELAASLTVPIAIINASTGDHDQ